MVRGGVAQLLNYEYVEVAYEAWFNRLGVAPRDVQQMHYARTLGASPPFHPCGECLLFIRFLGSTIVQ